MLPFAWPFSLSAQELPPVLDPAQIERQFDRPRQPGADPSGADIPSLPALAPAASSEPIAVLRRLVVNDMTVLDKAVLEPLMSQYGGREVSLADAQRMARILTNEYRNAGYILSQVIVPVQRIEEGVLTLQAVEGFIDKVKIIGRKHNTSTLLDQYVCKLMASKPLNAADLERYLLLADSLPGITANAVLRASPTTLGASNMDLIIEEERFEGYSRVDNRGSRFNGPNQIQFGANLNSLFGVHDRTRVRVVGASEFSELKLFELAQELPLGSEGMTLQVTGRYTESQPGGALKDSELESESVSASALLSYPLVRSRAKSVFARVALDLRDTDTDVLSERIVEDSIRALRAGLAFDFADRWGGINLIDVEVSQGLDILDASDKGDPMMSRADAEPEFFKTNVSVLRLQRLGLGFSALLSAEGQYSADRLVAAEEFALGGSVFGRAFDPSQVSGNRGFATRFELRHDHNLAPRYMDGMQLYTFYDYGEVWRRSSGSTPSSTDKLASAGAGWRFYIGESVSASVELAKPTIGNNISEGNDDARVLFDVSFEF